jgi:hypothetical protein
MDSEGGADTCELVIGEEVFEDVTHVADLEALTDADRATLSELIGSTGCVPAPRWAKSGRYLSWLNFATGDVCGVEWNNSAVFCYEHAFEYGPQDLLCDPVGSRNFARLHVGREVSGSYRGLAIAGAGPMLSNVFRAAHSDRIVFFGVQGNSILKCTWSR